MFIQAHNFQKTTTKHINQIAFRQKINTIMQIMNSNFVSNQQDFIHESQFDHAKLLAAGKTIERDDTSGKEVITTLLDTDVLCGRGMSFLLLRNTVRHSRIKSHFNHLFVLVHCFLSIFFHSLQAEFRIIILGTEIFVLLLLHH